MVSNGSVLFFGVLQKNAPQQNRAAPGITKKKGKIVVVSRAYVSDTAG